MNGAEHFDVVVRIDMRMGNTRKHRLEFGYVGDTRNDVSAFLDEVGKAIAHLPREGADIRS